MSDATPPAASRPAPETISRCDDCGERVSSHYLPTHVCVADYRESRPAPVGEAVREAAQYAVAVWRPLLADADLDAGSNPAWLAVERLDARSTPRTGEGT